MPWICRGAILFHVAVIGQVKEIRDGFAQRFETDRTSPKYLTVFFMGEVDDGRRRPTPVTEGTSVEIDRNRVAELLHSLVAGQGSRAAADVGAAHCHGTGTPQDLAGQVVVGNPQRNGPLGITKIHPE